MAMNRPSVIQNMRAVLGGTFFVAMYVATVTTAHAVPSYARQTGLPCSSCHTTLPELTPLGRLFKVNGYTFTGVAEITEKGGPTKAGLNLDTFLPLSAFFQTSFTATANRSQARRTAVLNFRKLPVCFWPARTRPTRAALFKSPTAAKRIISVGTTPTCDTPTAPK